ncbi:DUF2203 domain-containing protein [Actinomadura parmotrematis]|uniref:DUF2203 domain-containing protein n=1 Tax=Actinomadura parmotrematis TaxID=2864039 RepID=A0ABS7FZD2_9ACTN|nr:DUF2203 domain-containing protein [Actinomadura parmotrematis]MBW8484793.1 DUF2203 domain-containing protein [Actinomadura parmotrematis]
MTQGEQEPHESAEGSAAEHGTWQFTVEEARALVPQVRERAAEIVRHRADLAELALDLRAGGPSRLGGRPELKALEARLDELLTWFTGQGIEVKGIAPFLIDFPCVLDGAEVRLCWLEGDTELAWYHRADLGFAGRRPLP